MKADQVWPTLTTDRYSAHSTAHISIDAPSGTTSPAPVARAADSVAPAPTVAAKK